MKLYEVLDDPQVDKLYIIMEYVKNGSLLGLLSRKKDIEMNTYWRYTRDIVSGLLYRKIPNPY